MSSSNRSEGFELPPLLPEEVDPLIHAVELQLEGIALEYVVDTYDIFEFCYPVDPTSNHPVDVKRIADRQITLYELFFRGLGTAMLPPEYDSEMAAILSAFESLLVPGADTVEAIEGVLLHSGFDDSKFGEAIERFGLEGGIERDFRILFAARIGLAKTAIDRLRSILVGGKARRGYGTPESRRIRQILSNDTEGSVYDLVLEILDPSALKIRSASYDAQIIDRLYQLNHAFADRIAAGERSNRLFLYLSSAGRSRKIFGNPKMQHRRTQISGKSFDCWRTWPQLFALSVEHVRVGESALEETLDNLKDLKKVLEMLRRGRLPDQTEERCRACPLRLGDSIGGHSVPCRHMETCEGVQRHSARLQDVRGRLDDLGLVSKIRDYDEFSKNLTGGIQKKYHFMVKYFQDLYQEEEGLSWVREEQKDVLKLLEIRSGFAEQMVEELVRKEVHEAAFGRYLDDSVTVAAQVLPRHPRIREARNREICELILDYMDPPIGSSDDRLAIRDMAYRKFLELDQEIEENSEEHEVIRALLSLSFFNRKGDGHSFERLKMLLNEDNEHSAEPFYLALWAGRRAKKYGETDELAKRAIAMWPDDFRLYHGRQLNSFAWINSGDESCHRDLAFCAKDSKRSISLIAQMKEPPTETLAANYNNLVCAYSWNPADRAFSTKKARHALKRLKEILPPGDWLPRFPEFFHTEANLEGFEAKEMVASGAAKELIISKLQCAEHDANLAVKNARYKREHQDTLDRIRRLLDEVRKSP